MKPCYLFAATVALVLGLAAITAPVQAQGCTVMDLGGGITTISCGGRPPVSCIDLGGGIVHCS
jgi:hypothetical protein